MRIRTNLSPLNALALTFAVTFWPIFVIETASALPGFYRPSDSQIPPPIRDAAKGVVQIVVLDVDPVEVIDFEKFFRDYGNQTPEKVIRSQKFSPQVETLYLERLKYCRLNSFLKSCALYAPSSTGSGFFIEDGQSLWTDYHVIESIAAGIAKKFNREKGYNLEPWMVELSLEDQNLPIAIFDSANNLLFMSGIEDSSAHLDLKPFDFAGLPLFGIMKDSVRASSDFARIRLSKSVGKPLVLAKTLPTKGASVYAIGFPTGTGPNKNSGGSSDHDDELITRAPFPDSSGTAQHVSIGSILNPLEGLNRIRVDQGLESLSETEWSRTRIFEKFNLFPKAGELDLSQIVFSEIDVVFGNSGGPLVNSVGEVIGMAQSIAVEHADSRYWRTTLMSINLIEVDRKRRKRKPAR